MAVSIDELISKADVGLQESNFNDAKKFVEQALKRVSVEKNEYIRTLPEKDEKKEEKIAQWYSQCGCIFFKVRFTHCKIYTCINSV
jgi:hypothetical protein